MKKRNTKILVIDDDTRLRKLLKQYLEQEGYDVEMAKNASEAKDTLKDKRFDLLVVDVMMPGQNGKEFTKELRMTNDTPVLMLTALNEVSDRVSGLESGVDDYLGKPFEPKELVLRIESILKRTKKILDVVKFGEYTFNITTGDLFKDDELINLTSTELKLLQVFAKNIDKPVSREDLSREFNGIGERSIDVQVTRLRKKIEEDPKEPIYLESQRGAGYVLRSRQYI